MSSTVKIPFLGGGHCIRPSPRLLTALRSLLPNDRSWPGGEVEEYVSIQNWGSDVRI
jgi:hypothetical protein